MLCFVQKDLLFTILATYIPKPLKREKNKQMRWEIPPITKVMTFRLQHTRENLKELTND